MQQIPIYFKSDFKLFIRTEAGFAVPFKFEFYTNMPSRPYIAKFDGHKYHNCELLEDGRLCIAFDDHGFGLGKLMIRQSYYLNDADYASEICDRVIAPQPVVNIDDNLLRSEIVLALSGDDTIEFTSQLPPYYQAGLTPEEHEALIDATNDATAAADNANSMAQRAASAAGLADSARKQITDTFVATINNLNADYQAKKEALERDYTSEKGKLLTDYTQVKSALQSDYDAKLAALAADYAAKKEALDTDYTNIKVALAADYAAAIELVDERMTAIESQYVTDKAAWQAEVDAIIAKMQQDFEAAEAQRELRVNTAVQSANTSASNADRMAHDASKVNAVLNGDELTVTDRNGQSVTRNVRGPKGDSVTMFPAVTIFGQPRIQETQMSEFSAANYAQFPFLVDFAGRHWQLDCAITTGADVSQQHNVFDSAFGLAFAFKSGKFLLAMSSNGTSWNLGATSGTHNIAANTTYYIRITWDGANYVLAYSTDKANWTNDITVASAESLASKQIIIGKSLDNAHIFNGSINFAEARLTIANVIVWEGMEEVGTATRMAIDMSNIDEAGKQRVNDLVVRGMLGQLIGPYAKHVVIPLTASYATGKVLVVNPATGMVELTEKAGWGVTRLTAEALKAQHVDQGDTAFVYMLDSEGRNLNEDGIKVFVIETEVKGEDGQVIRRTLTSKFNAPNADVTLSGHLQTGYDLQPDQNLLICHPLSTSSVEFLRTAEGAKEATTKLNLTAMMEKLATKEGVFLQMIAGLAEGIWDTNPESGNAREWLVGRPVIGCPDLVIPRMNDIDARSGQNKDIVVDKVAGGVVGGNQAMQIPVSKNNAGTNSTSIATKDGDYYLLGLSGTGANQVQFSTSLVTTKKYLAMAELALVNNKATTAYFYLGGNTKGNRWIIDEDRTIADVMVSDNNVSTNAFRLYYNANTELKVGDTLLLKKMLLLDLTLLFPLDQPFVTSLRENDATRVLTRLGIIALDD